MRPAYADLRSGRAHWLLELEVNGAWRRYASAGLEVTSYDGTTYRYREGVDPLNVALSSAGSVDAAQGITLYAEDQWDELARLGVVMSRSRAVLRHWVEGTALEDALVIIRGRVYGWTYEERHQPVRFSIRRSVRELSRTFPSPGMVVDSTTWPVRAGYTFDAEIVGMYYPIVIGNPGLVSAGVTVAATEALLVELHGTLTDHRMLVAGHRVATTTVDIYDYTDDGAPASASRTVNHTEDRTGRTIAYVNMAGSGLTIDKSRTYYCGWRTPALAGAQGTIRGAGDVIVWMYETWSDVQIDRARMAAVLEFLNRYKVDVRINEPTDVSWVSSVLLPHLPVEPVEGEEGVWFRRLVWRQKSSDVVGRLDADLGQAERVSPVVVVDDNVINEVTVEYRNDRYLGGYRSRIIVGGDTDHRTADELQPGLATADARYMSNARAKVSQGQYGRRPVTVALDWTWDTSTAVQVALDVIDQHALPHRAVSYAGELWLSRWSEGDVLELNDTRVGLVNVRARVADVSITDSTATLMLQIIDEVQG